MPVWPGKLLRLVDDRGTKFSVKPKETALRVGMDRANKAAFKAWWKRNRRRFVASTWRGQLTVWAGVALFFLIFNSGGSSTVQYVGGLLALGFMGLGLSLTIKGYYQASMNGFAALGRCGLCGYTLRGLQEEDDGCTICPECGAAWRLGGEPQALGKGDEVGRPGKPPSP